MGRCKMHSGAARIFQLIRCVARTKKSAASALVSASRVGNMSPMPTPRHATLRALRMKYNAANSAYHECVRARTEATMSGGAASHDQLKGHVGMIPARARR